jgi:hypothetical protein
MIGYLKETLLAHRAAWGLPNSEDWTFLVYNNYHPHCSDIDVLWFCRGESHPRVVTKVSREPERPRREYSGLQEVHAVASRWTPRPLCLDEHESLWMLWMEGVPGTRLHARAIFGSAASVVESITGIHDALRRPPSGDSSERFRESALDPLTALSRFGNSAAVSEGCRRILETTSREWLGGLPVIPQHGDLYDGNLLCDRGAWRVIDWETFGTVTLPGYDLFTFLLSLLFARGRSSTEWPVGVTDRMPLLTAQYAARMGLGRKDMPLLLPLTLANWFYIQWRDGRAEFSNRIYATTADYFGHQRRWEETFFSEATEWPR